MWRSGVMRAIAAAVLGLGTAVAGAQVSTAKTVLCAVSQVLDCRFEDTCERESPEDIGLPRFFRLDATRNTLSADGADARTAPVRHVERVDGRILVQGSQGTRAWSMVITESSGLMSGAIAEPEGTFVISGACLNPGP
jgi:hypothetical protein